MILLSSTIAERFWAKVDKRGDNDCWNWVGGLTTHGYGSINKGFWHGGNVSAPRISWILHYGEIPKGLWVLHKCDNRKCVNPKHLYLGTAADNAKDRVLRGREGNRKGERNGRAKLNWNSVNYIRKHFIGQYGQLSLLARQFNVSVTQIQYIVTGKSWKNES